MNTNDYFDNLYHNSNINIIPRLNRLENAALLELIWFSIIGLLIIIPVWVTSMLDLKQMWVKRSYKPVNEYAMTSDNGSDSDNMEQLRFTNKSRKKKATKKISSKV